MRPDHSIPEPAARSGRLHCAAEHWPARRRPAPPPLQSARAVRLAVRSRSTGSASGQRSSYPRWASIRRPPESGPQQSYLSPADIGPACQPRLRCLPSWVAPHPDFGESAHGLWSQEECSGRGLRRSPNSSSRSALSFSRRANNGIPARLRSARQAPGRPRGELHPPTESGRKFEMCPGCGHHPTPKPSADSQNHSD